MRNCKIALRRMTLWIAAVVVMTLWAAAADLTASTPGEFYSALEQSLRSQDDRFSIAYTGDRTELDLPDQNPLAYALRNMSARSPDGPDNADYPALNVSDGQMGWLDGAYYFTIDYLATPEQLDEVARQAAEIVDSLQLEGEDAYTRIKLLYEYVCTHFTYDDTLTKYSAYDGLTTGSMVCQGYALLTSQVMWEAGIPCRIITGTSAGENHAWNIVELDGVWYNLDTTWDAADEAGGVMHWVYFLKNQEDFLGHKRYSPYVSQEYDEAHPMAEESLELPQVLLTLNGSGVSNLVMRAGMPVQLEASLSNGRKVDLAWSSGNADLVSVTDEGWISASGVGSTVLTIGNADDRGIISAQLPVTVVDLRTASPWAYETVTEYYLAQMLPHSLCTGFQQPLTRAELARLCYQFIQQQRGWGTVVYTNPFTDLEDCPDLLQILCCRSIGLMMGTSDTTFSPDAPVTREQAAVVLSRLMAYLEDWEVEDETLPYADAGGISPWARISVAAVTEAGVMQGSGGNFHPQQPMTLEQMVVALCRVYAVYAADPAAAA